MGIYTKNIFNTRVLLTSNAYTTGSGVDPVFGPPGFNTVVTTRPREVGVMVRYAFGSR